MNLRLKKKLEEYKATQPTCNGSGMYSQCQKRHHAESPFVPGIVVDNKDPECMGRVRVQMDLLSPGCVGPWYQLGGKWTGSGQGIWSLPDIGTQVLVAFPYGDVSRGIVLGCLYDEKHLPPETYAEKKPESMLFQTRNHRIEITDEDGKEGIRIETREGKIRCVLDSENGIQLVNELGDIKVRCRNLTVESEKNIELNGKKKVAMAGEDAVSVKSSKDTRITSDKEITAKGKNIKLTGSKGVCAEGKQMAVQDDKVVGMDIHIMVVPSGSGTATVPLPHPFMGKLNDSLADDVMIGSKKVAVKGSKAKHDDSMHMQLPGTIKFQSNPKKEGEVTGGTSAKVKIDGKEAAVIGSQVTTCNDMGIQNNSTVIAAGASFPMPAIINPKNTEEYERERKEQEDRNPRFSDVKWSTIGAGEGKEAELTASVQDIADGNMATLLVFPEGKGPEDSVPLASFPCTVKGGSVSARWSYRASQKDMPPESNPRFTFTAHCAWCNFEKSSNVLEVKLIRPEIKKVEWQDKDGSSTSKGLVGEVLKMHAETKDVEGGITFHVYDEHKREVHSVGADIKDNAAEAEWMPIDNRMPENTNPLKYTIEATASRCKAVESGVCQIKNPKILSMEWNKKAIYYGDDAVLRIKSKDMVNSVNDVKLCLYVCKPESALYCIFETEIKFDKDIFDYNVALNFSLKELNLTEKDLELFVQSKIISIEGDILCEQRNFLRVGIGYLYE